MHKKQEKYCVDCAFCSVIKCTFITTFCECEKHKGNGISLTEKICKDFVKRKRGLLVIGADNIIFGMYDAQEDAQKKLIELERFDKLNDLYYFGG